MPNETLMHKQKTGSNKFIYIFAFIFFAVSAIIFTLLLAVSIISLAESPGLGNVVSVCEGIAGGSRMESELPLLEESVLTPPVLVSLQATTTVMATIVKNLFIQ